MTPFDPKAMARNRGQVLYRFRPNQTFDHVGGYTAQVRQYARDDAYHGPVLDDDYLIGEAMHFVRRWRAEGRRAPGTTASDRAPEYPEDLPLAEQHYTVTVPGKVYCLVWPRVFRCSRPTCGRVWESADPRPGVDQWPPACPACNMHEGNRQLQFVFVHQCGELAAMRPPESCPRGHTRGFRLNDHVSRFKDFRWECLACRLPIEVRAFCANRSGCRWDNKMMSPLVHTAGSAFVGHGVTVVNPPTRDFSRVARTPAFIVGTLGRWLGECTEEEARGLAEGNAGGELPEEVADAIRGLEEAGLHERAQRLRGLYPSVDISALRTRVATRLGYDPVDDDRGVALARHLATYQRVVHLSRIDLARLRATAPSSDRASRYATYPHALSRAGFEPSGTALVTDFPVTYLALGYSRGGFAPTEADLVAYKGRAAQGQALTTLLYANPTDTEALTFALDSNRVDRWLVANALASEDELDRAGGSKRWFAARLDPFAGQLPTWDASQLPTRDDSSFGTRALFELLHTAAHQLVRALAVDSGYSETGLSEYLFPYDLAFAVHPNGGSEFTIGALRTVLEQNLDEIIDRAVDSYACLYDPNCMLANRGADHGCLHLPETSCQSWNRFLSRWHLYGDPQGEWIGYWDPRLGASA
jgi:hypothetical protein